MKRLCLAATIFATVLVAPIAVPTARAADKSAPQVIHTLSALTDAPNLAPLNGKTVKLSAVTVLSIEGSRGFWIGEPKRSIFVLSARNVVLKPGQKVALTGVLSTAPADGEMLEWRVGDKVRERVTKDGYYILAAVTVTEEARASR